MQAACRAFLTRGSTVSSSPDGEIAGEAATYFDRFSVNFELEWVTRLQF